MTIPQGKKQQTPANGKGNKANNVSVRAMNLVRNRRLSRGLSRTLSAHSNASSHHSRSPSPSKQKSLPKAAAQIEQAELNPPNQPQISSPPIEQTPLLLLRFTPKATRKLILLVETRLQKHGLIILDKIMSHDENDETTTQLLLLSAQRDALEAFAEQIKWRKRTTDTNVVEYFSAAHRHKYVSIDNELFTSNECCHLALRLLDSVEVWLDTKSSSELNLMLMLQEENPPPVGLASNEPEPSDDDEQDDNNNHNLDNISPAIRTILFDRRQSFHRRQSMRLQRVQAHGKRSSFLRHVLEANQYVDVVTPLHQGPTRDEIVANTWKPWPLMPPVQQIRNYYGEDIAFYFAWMGFLSHWLVVLGSMGLLIALFRIYRNDTIDEDEFTPFYGIFTFLWAVLFLRFWQRHEHRLAYQWGTYSLSIYERQKFTITRPNFRGILRKSPVTGEYETYYPPTQRLLKYIGSGIVTILMLSVAFMVMICSLNAQNYIHPERNPSRWGIHNPHPFHSPMIAKLSNPGNWFDATHPYKSMIPTILHVAMIFNLNSIYRRIAEQLTDWENHETEASHRNSLILKRFLFEAFDCYVALFYLAFYERDVDRLRLELVTIFNVDTFRRMLLECIVPMILQKVSQSSRKNKTPQEQHHTGKREEASTNVKKEAHEAVIADLLKEADKDEYEAFDDYMEIVIQFGYVTLFASAYPLASLVALVANWIEIRSDCFKLAKVCRRPRSYRSDGIGVWNSLLSCVVWTSALTNCLIVGFTSDQMMQIFPNFYMQDSHGDTHLVHDKGWMAVFVIFGLERILLCIGLLIYAIVPEIPEDVKDEVERLHYIRAQEHEEVLRQVLRKISSKKAA